MQEGQITKAISGFYYIKAEDGQVYQTRARGVFRKEGINPLVGDYVEFKSDNLKEGTLLAVKKRENDLTRPAIANVDVGIVVTSIVEPDFSSQLLDRFLVSLEYKHITPIIYLSKIDIASKEDKEKIADYKEIYEKIGYPFITIDVSEIDNLKAHLKTVFKNFFREKLVVFIGQSGAGKSTLLNYLNPEFDLETAETSKALGRGKHTTRHVELFPLYGGLFADTPGYSALSFLEIEVGEISDCFPEMRERSKNCRFRGCLHQNEPNCAIKKAVEDKIIEGSRYKNYLQILKEVQERKPRY
ncbi:MAG: ribosome small subunit-dependent GTPase A [Atopostipes suicloacalis]|nr:ribosome small subunit-dependent GTPase A [Atopostipes suicloacalis]